MSRTTPSPGEPTASVREDPRVELRRVGQAGGRERLAEDVRRGLGGERKQLPPKYFYDERGSRLFDEITRLPEYYLARAEREILEASAPAIVEVVRPAALVEFGAGSATKTRLLLDAMEARGSLGGYAPVDVSETALAAAAARLVERYPGLRVVGLVTDFEAPLPLPFEGERRLVALLGSTIGNFTRERAEVFLASVAGRMAPEDAFLVGFDLVKEPARLEAAYDDAAGVTAAFNRNVLRVLNRELGADFEPESFRHRAVYDEEERRIEMHLVAERDQVVRIAELDMEVPFAAGESILTELSHKYTRGLAEELLVAAGLSPVRWDTDEGRRFALGLARLP